MNICKLFTRASFVRSINIYGYSLDLFSAIALVISGLSCIAFATNKFVRASALRNKIW